MKVTKSSSLPPGIRCVSCPELRAAWDDIARMAADEGMSATKILDELDEAIRLRHIEQVLRRRLVGSGLTEFWHIETFPFADQPEIKKSRIDELANTLSFVRSGNNVILIGGTGVGKTGIASGLFVRAIESGFSGYFVRMNWLLEKRAKSAALLQTDSLLRRYSSVDLLVLDEVGYSEMSPADAAFLLEIMTYRERKATIVTSNLGFSDWPSMLGKEAKDIIMAPIIDRLTRGAAFFDLRKASSIRGVECNE